MDPQFLDVFHRFCFWRRFFWKFPSLFQEFLDKLHQGGMPDRPAGAMARSAANLGWKPFGRFFQHPWFGFIDWLRRSTKFLGFALAQTWMRLVCADLKVSRPGFNIAAVDVQGMKNLFCKLSPTGLGAVRFFVHGGNYTHDILTKWDASKTLQRPNCEMPDSKYHRVFQRKAYDAFRFELPNLFSKLGRLPEAVWRFGLAPLSADPWPLLQHLHQTPLEFSFPSLTDSLHIFVDGSCFWPQDRLFSIAGAATVVADMTCNGEGIIRPQVLPGIEQSIDRAEVFAILLALQLSECCTVYSDCQYAVESARVRMKCLQQSQNPPAMKHMDLWDVFDALMAKRPTGAAEFVKVKAHVSCASKLPEFLDRCRHYNHLADLPAKRAVREADCLPSTKRERCLPNRTS